MTPATSTAVNLSNGRHAAHGVPRRRALSIGFVGTYPPEKCGIATFTASSLEAIALADPRRRVGVVASVESPWAVPKPTEVVAELVRGSRASLDAAVAALNEFDVVVVQHEFGIFGGPDGAEVVELVARLRVPVVVVLHTVLAQPSLNQRAVIERLAELSARIVVQTEVARTRFLENHRVPPRNVVVIPHGAPANLTPALQLHAASYRPTILTWGLIGPSKGIEYAIEAMAQLRDLDPLPRYVVMGETHPKIVHASGEEYRLGLIERARELGVDEIVAFEDGYRDTAGILARVRSADIILLPYLSRDQVVSGVLVEAIASGKPVVSTAFPHAVEVLEAGSGIVIPHEDVDAMADALRAFLTDRQTLARAAFVARAQAPDLFWESVGRSYDALAAEIVGVRALAC